MKKKFLLLTSLGLMSATALGVFAISRTKQIEPFQVRAYPTEYSVTFDADASVEKIEEIDWLNCNEYGICTNTPKRNKVGLIGHDDSMNHIAFKGTSYWQILLYDYNNYLNTINAFSFSYITNLQVNFTGGELVCEYKTAFGSATEKITSGEPLDMEFSSSEKPVLNRKDGSEEVVTISSITIWYSC